MFITSKYSGYNRRGEQVAAGLFLILLEPKNDSGQFPSTKDVCSDCGLTRANHELPLFTSVQEISDKLHRAWKHLFSERCAVGQRTEDNKDACEIIMDAQRRVTGCRYFRASNISYPIRAIVRHTSMRQLGHFMMGFARVHGHRITLSGSYGGDGLICTVPDAVYNAGIELPVELRDAWNSGGGWNDAGSEAPAMRKWALSNLAALRGR
jgi:hypothetical protein